MIARLTTGLAKSQVLTYAGSLTAMLFAPVAQFALFAFYARVLGVGHTGCRLTGCRRHVPRRAGVHKEEKDLFRNS